MDSTEIPNLQYSTRWELIKVFLISLQKLGSPLSRLFYRVVSESPTKLYATEHCPHLLKEDSYPCIYWWLCPLPFSQWKQIHINYASSYKSRWRFWHVHHFHLDAWILQYLCQNSISEQCSRYISLDRLAHNILANSHVLWNTIMYSYINVLSIVYYFVFCSRAFLTCLEKITYLILFYYIGFSFYFLKYNWF